MARPPPAATATGPSDPARRPPVDGSVAAASLVRRMAAFAYEGILVFGIVFATGLVYGVAMRQTNAMTHRTGLVATCFIVLGLYFVGLWTRSGQTLAMKTWHLRIVTRAGAPLSPRRALARYLAAWIWFLPPLALSSAFVQPDVTAYLGLPVAWIALYAATALLHPRRQFWHDALCGTAIVTARPAAALPS